MERSLADLADPFAMSPVPPDGRWVSLADLGMIGSEVSQGLAQWLATPGRALRGDYDVTPEVPGEWSEADEYRLQLANRELVDWGPQTALAMLGLARFPGGAPRNALGAAGGGKMVQPDLPPQHAPNFIVSPSGTTFPVPAGAVGPSAVRTKKGVQYEGGSGGYGFDPRTTGLKSWTRCSPGDTNTQPGTVCT